MEYIDFYKNSNTYKIVSADIANKMVSHAYLLTGKDEKLLDEFAMFICKQILCDINDEIICNRLDNGNYPDVKTYPTADKKTILVEDVNEIVSDSIVYPYEGDRKLYILKNFDETLAASQNKLLKTLEEPIPSVTFIITSTLPYNVLPTIRSRCKILKVEEPSREDIISFVCGLGKSQEEAEELTDLSGGSLANVYKLLQDQEFIQMQKCLINVIKNMNSSGELLSYSGEVMKYKDRLGDVFDEFLSLMRDLMVLKAGGQISKAKASLRGCEDRFSAKAISELSKAVVEENKKLKANCNPSGVVEHFLMKMLEVKSR